MCMKIKPFYYILSGASIGQATPLMHVYDIIGAAGLPDDLNTWWEFISVMLSDPSYYPSFIGFVLICLGLFPKLRFWEKVNNSKYSKEIGFLVSDVIEANRIEPIKSKIPHIEDAPRSYCAYWKLENVSSQFIIDDEVKEKLIKFLNFFDVKNKSLGGMRIEQSIRANFDNQSDLEDHKSEIIKLAKYLTKKLP